MWYIKEDFSASDAVLPIAFVFIRPWLAMLALGSIGHRLDYPRLFIDYWTVWLAVLATRMFFGNGTNRKFKAAQTRKELK